ncbi:cobalt-precorrin-6A reductase [Clostridium sp. D2Q-11]|uniref:Cobalt-precorrin-6A reductase n=1 Tax=Anaeromonas frigoriresistens TaxID=2683708 RepID=A0A942V236_9FIRM|nr:cobalt-precorrin-6A reductase [Anaeromonas frigoriresistens]MBS4538577.1 cobalt-precorrin-6A reductase [Anaeromonas frigoriresistens]
MILVLSGTQDGRDIVVKLLEQGYSVLATTATEYGGKLFKNHPMLDTISQRLDENDMEKIIDENDIKILIDATHPYASEASKNAMKAANIKNISYLRFEREKINVKGIRRFSDYDEIIKFLQNKSGNILLTTGSNNLDKFKIVPFKERLYIRVLPTHNVIKKCNDLGFLPKQILGLQGPFSSEFNRAIYEFYKIDYIVTKDSGKVGGTYEKIKSALDMNVEVLLINRPSINYTNVATNIEDLLKSIKNIGGKL